MNRIDTIRAWKDEAFRASLTEAERASLPDHPAGLVELYPSELQGVAAGNGATPGMALAAKPRRTRGCPNPRTLFPRQCPDRPTYVCTLVCPVGRPF